jgi:hypothetical protein
MAAVLTTSTEQESSRVREAGRPTVNQSTEFKPQQPVEREKTMNLSYTGVKAALSKRKTRWIVGGVLFLGTATPSFAIFGLGDIVFDPTSYASLVSQLSTLTSMYTTAKNQYSSMIQSAKSFSVKSAWQTQLNQLKNVNVANTFGETNGLTAALNSDSTTTANTAWKSSNVTLSPDTTNLLSGQSVGSSTQLSQLAMIEASDAASPDCINAVGSYRAARSNTKTAEQNLQSQQLDGSDATNSEVEQLNLLNAGQAQQMNDQQAQGSLQTCIATQVAIQNMQQRNAAARDLNTAAYIRQQNLTAPKHPENQGDTWNNFLP